MEEPGKKYGMLCEIDTSIPEDVRLCHDLKLAELAGYRFRVCREIRLFRSVLPNASLRKIARDRRRRETPGEIALNAIRRQKRRRHYELNPQLRTTPEAR